MSTPQLVIPNAPLTKVAKRLLKAASPRRVRSGTLRLQFREGALLLEILGGQDSVPASGQWSGALQIPGTALVLFALGNLRCDEVTLTFAESVLHVRGGTAHIKFKGQWEDISPATLDLPIDATDRDFLRLSLTNHSPAQIAASGLEKQIAESEKRFQKNIDKAVPLFSQYRVSRADLEAAIRALILSR